MTNHFRTAVLCAAMLAVASTAPLAGAPSIVTAVYSRVSKEYERELAADGSPKPEYYAIARGKYLPGASADSSIDEIEFPKIAGVVAEYLAKQNYFYADSAEKAGLLLMITWGTTVPFSDGAYRSGLHQLSAAMNSATQAALAPAEPPTPDGIQSPSAAVAGAARSAFEGQLLQLQMFEDMRMKANESNAKLLGYIREINDRNDISRYAGGGDYYNDLIADIENERYFIIISAYDFKSAVNGGEPRILWSTRVSIQRDGSKFDEDMATMVARASKFFGRDSGRLVRRYSEGVVTLGEAQVVGIVDDPKNSGTKTESEQ